MSEANESAMRVLKSGACMSLSGKSKLHYDIAVGAAADVHVRVSKSSGTGYFNPDWVAWDRVQKVLDKNGAKPITSHTLGPLFQGRSINNEGFLLAILKSEGLVQRMAEKPRCFERLDPSAFNAELQSLMTSSGATGRKPPRKAAAKKTAAGKTMTRK